MNNLLAIAILSIAFIIVGYPFLRSLAFSTRIEKMALSFLLGSGLLTLSWFFLYLVSGRFTLTSFFLATVMTSLIGLISSKFITPAKHVVIPPFKKFDSWILGIILVITLIATVVAWYNPITSWDSLTLYDFRGLVIAQSGNLRSIETSTYYLSYPLMTSLVHAAFYLFGGSNPQIFYPLVYASLLAIIYGRMMVWSNRRFAGITTLLVAINPLMFEHATISYTNLPYTALLISGFFYSSSAIIISGILIGLSTWVRSSEPFWIVGALMIMIAGIRQKKYSQTIASLGFIILIKMIWSLYLGDAYTRIGLIGDTQTEIYNLAMFSKIYANLGSMSAYLWQFIISPYLGYWVVTLFAAIATIYLRSILLGATVLIFAMVVAGVAVFSTYYESWYSIGGSAMRMLLFVIPLITVMGVQLYYLLRYRHDKN